MRSQKVRTLLCLVCLQASSAFVFADESTQSKLFLQTVQSRAVEVASQFDPSVVSIAIIAVNRQRSITSDDFLLQRQSRQIVSRPTDPNFIADRYATGLVWDKNGSIVTMYSSLGDPNEHEYVVWNRGFAAQAQLSALQAKLIAGEPYTNLAVLRVLDDKFAENSVPARPQQVTNPQRGELCFRVACPGPLARDGAVQVQWGSVENINRDLRPNLQIAENTNLDQSNIYAHGGTFQTSHSAYEDMAGAAIVNLQGDLIGIAIDNAEIAEPDAAGSFALPINATAIRVIDALVQGKLPSFGFLGIQPGEVSASQRRVGLRGVQIDATVPDMPGEIAGLRSGDIIRSIVGQPLENRNAIFRELAAFGPGDSVYLSIARPRGAEVVLVEANVTLSKRLVATYRPAFALEPIKQWRGLQVDFATAFPPEMLLNFMRNYQQFSPQSIAISDVELASPAWEAGLRMGYQIESVNGVAITSDTQFYSLVDDPNKQYQITYRNAQAQRLTIKL